MNNVPTIDKQYISDTMHQFPEGCTTTTLTKTIQQNIDNGEVKINFRSTLNQYICSQVRNGLWKNGNGPVERVQKTTTRRTTFLYFFPKKRKLEQLTNHQEGGEPRRKRRKKNKKKLKPYESWNITPNKKRQRNIEKDFLLNPRPWCDVSVISMKPSVLLKNEKMVKSLALVLTNSLPREGKNDLLTYCKYCTEIIILEFSSGFLDQKQTQNISYDKDNGKNAIPLGFIIFKETSMFIEVNILVANLQLKNNLNIKGIGTHLLNLVKRRGKQIYLHPDPGAERFYLNRGFCEVAKEEKDFMEGKIKKSKKQLFVPVLFDDVLNAYFEPKLFCYFLLY